MAWLVSVLVELRGRHVGVGRTDSESKDFHEDVGGQPAAVEPSPQYEMYLSSGPAVGLAEEAELDVNVVEPTTGAEVVVAVVEVTEAAVLDVAVIVMVVVLEEELEIELEKVSIVLYGNVDDPAKSDVGSADEDEAIDVPPHHATQ